MSDDANDSDDELGEVGDQINGIADRFGTSDDTTETTETIDTSETTTTDQSQSGDMTETTETTTTTGTSETTETSETLGPGDEGFQLRADWNGRTIYLPDDVVDDLDLTYQQMNLKWMEEHGEELPKNERFYPAVIRAALNDTTIESDLGLADSV